MVECPKCTESGLIWIKTKSGKNWLKRDLGDGQVSREWHTCSIIAGEDKPLHSFCHECHTRLTSEDWCSNCNRIVMVVDKR